MSLSSENEGEQIEVPESVNLTDPMQSLQRETEFSNIEMDEKDERSEGLGPQSGYQSCSSVNLENKSQIEEEAETTNKVCDFCQETPEIIVYLQCKHNSCIHCLLSVGNRKFNLRSIDNGWYRTGARVKSLGMEIGEFGDLKITYELR